MQGVSGMPVMGRFGKTEWSHSNDAGGVACAPNGRIWPPSFRATGFCSSVWNSLMPMRGSLRLALPILILASPLGCGSHSSHPADGGVDGPQNSGGVSGSGSLNGTGGSSGPGGSQGGTVPDVVDGASVKFTAAACKADTCGAEAKICGWGSSDAKYLGCLSDCDSLGIISARCPKEAAALYACASLGAKVDCTTGKGTGCTAEEQQVATCLQSGDGGN